MDTTTRTREFFDGYRRALLARDEQALADLYAVPALILFPGRSLPVTDREQTAEFFASAFGQYEEVAGMTAEVVVVAQAPHSVWADVTWRHDTLESERFVYQLLDESGIWRIAVLTPLPVG
ncbi:hypothetical protein [Cellulosimicrobium marinum]|uniref:hypothetical protein n=1 Tax=Cellulosimicrobium marinum TaxID=1638992 RepID=UPI001E49B6BB|nr:hypothetical protein [Cellulosimicrobium marinum]MCB7136050.1 hypothetical protein [Cellulosimicrobium marinum]